ncbi:WD40 repeat-like protein [Exidia glandulosa HHB12029]|uniref:WD40 repeat-like protein n=1 Tax=Exidia glandulosa HHB12029 TaxID=1314781 RepID=A0A165KTL5_EXIGL|nr:WD40 repeat-like protein [Exidia glandulosa HHB12029]
MIQTGVLPESHGETITDGAYDHYGLHLATCSSDQRIKIWALDESTGNWSLEDEWKAHDARICSLSWVHPEHGSLLASSSFDCTARIWAPRDASGFTSRSGMGASMATDGSSEYRSAAQWAQTASLRDAKGSVRAVAFAPPFFGLKIATLATDGALRLYDGHAYDNWQLRDEIDMGSPSTSSTSVSATLDGVAATLAGSPIASVASGASGSATPGAPAPARGGGGGRLEADGGWAMSWCPDRWDGHGLLLAVACGRSSAVRIVHFPLITTPTKRSQAQHILTLEREQPSPYSVTAVAWAPSLGRTHHRIATGGRDGHVRIWKVVLPANSNEEVQTQLIADFDDHKAAVSRVEWNCTGTVLSSSGYDGRVRLWKVSFGNVWRGMGYVTGETVDVDVPDGVPEEEQDDQ